jgi:hypothetical protein
VANADWLTHLPWVMLGLRSAWRQDSSFLSVEAVLYGAQPVLPGQFSPPAFLADLQRLLTELAQLSTTHHNTPTPLQVPEDFLLARHVLKRKNGHVPPLAAAYDGPYLVLERSLRFYMLQIGNRQENISTLRLKACISPPEMQAAEPPKRGRPPRAAKAAPPADSTTSTAPSPPSQRAQHRRVTFRCPAVSTEPSSLLPPHRYPSRRPARSEGPPKRLFSLVHNQRLRLGGSFRKTADPSLLHLYFALHIFLLSSFLVPCLGKMCKNILFVV